MRFCFALMACLALTLSSSVHGQISDSQAHQFGLESAWVSQIQVPKFGRGVVSYHFWVDSTHSTKYAVVELPDRTVRVSAAALDRRGAMIGIDVAKEQARRQAARLLGKSDGFEVVETEVPNIKLVLVTSDGLVQTLDAETGERLWVSSCGSPTSPAQCSEVSEAGVSVVQGDELYLLDWETGKHRDIQKLDSGSATSIAVANGVGFVLDLRGKVQAVGIGQKVKPWHYVVIGKTTGRAVGLRSQPFCAITTDRGFVYVFSAGEIKGEWLRYESSNGMSECLAAGNNSFYAGTHGGALAKINISERIGRLDWEFRCGQSLVRPALPIGKSVFVATQEGELIAVDDSNGYESWSSNRAVIEEPIAKIGPSLLCKTTSSELAIFNATTGDYTGKTNVLNLSIPIANTFTDRGYILMKNGRVQCLRGVGAALPTMFTSVPADAAAGSETEAAPEMAAASKSDAVADPFGGFGSSSGADAFDASDPFGNSNDATEDPFGNPAGNDENPFQF